jgi:ATP-dependent DNA helicase RecG
MPEPPRISVEGGDASANARWERPATDVRLVDSRRAAALARLGIHTVGDLITHYPLRYLDLTTVPTIHRAALGGDATVVGTVRDIRVKRPRPRLTIVEIAVGDESGVMVAVWFNQPYVAQRVNVGDRVAIAGTVEMDFGLKQMKSPFLERLGEQGGPEDLGRVLPVHPATEGLSTAWMRRLVAEALAHAGGVRDPLPVSLRTTRNLVPRRTALSDIHFPRHVADAGDARHRLAYEELLLQQLAVLSKRARLTREQPAHPHVIDGPAVRALAEVLPFALTDDQRRTVDEILADLASQRPMNRMLLGDVGTGKTAVAAFALAACADSGTQAAMMAPTEVLAEQYATKLGPVLDELGVAWRLLKGSTTAAERRETLAVLASGTCTVLFGTHALIQRGVDFAHLTLAVVDEQHRFGVRQRLALRRKGEAVDLLVMTATPIPRSLALTMYGDLDTSYLRARPGDRGPGHVKTELVNCSSRARAYDRITSAVRTGRQAYVVCALVEESDSAEARAATLEAERLQKQVFPELRVDLLTGRMKSREKMAVMERFRAGATDVLVATTVIEVGVDVPNATIMIVEDGERFGLAQLHQLRGRIGRGEHPGEFLVFADPKSEQSRRRMAAIATTNDGFALAEEDLRVRGEGEVLGERQSGLPRLKLASLVSDFELLVRVREDATVLLDEDPGLDLPQHVLLRREVEGILRETDASVRSG